MTQENGKGNGLNNVLAFTNEFADLKKLTTLITDLVENTHSFCDKVLLVMKHTETEDPIIESFLIEITGPLMRLEEYNKRIMADIAMVRRRTELSEARKALSTLLTSQWSQRALVEIKKIHFLSNLILRLVDLTAKK